MEPEHDTPGRPRKGKKRKRTPNPAAGPTEPARPPQAKKARLSAILLAENCEVTHGQLCELLKYAVLGKSSIPKPRSGCAYSSVPTGTLLPASSKASINLQNDPIIQKYGSKKVDLTRCLLTKEEMKTFYFPLQGSPDYENFVLTECNGSITDYSPLFGLDCEMCLTSKGRELTRISLVAKEGFCVMDELVKPDDKILDYLTSFSGITKKILHPVKTKLKDVQKQLKELLPPDAVLVGHSLDLDLRALKMIHPHVIDTSLLYLRRKGRRFKLKFLAKVILGKDIQCSNRLSHDSIEDARTTLELAQYFLKYGPKKVAKLNLEALASHQELKAAGQELRNTTEVLQHPNKSVLECMDSVGQKLLFLTQDSDELSSSPHCQTIKCLSNKEVLEQARVEIPLFPFNIVQFEPFSLIPSEETKRMRTKWTEMSTVYAGPFHRNCNLGALKKIFNSFGPVQSMTLLLETHKPHLCIHYEVLEAAQLAIESMNGILVHRPVTEFTLDCDTFVKELEQDSENQGTIYVAGMSENFKVQLLQQSNVFLGLEVVILPKHPKNRKNKNYCFMNSESKPPEDNSLALEPEIEKLYHSLNPGTLCLILLPGIKSAFGSLSGLGLMRIKDEEERDTPGIGE